MRNVEVKAVVLLIFLLVGSTMVKAQVGDAIGNQNSENLGAVAEAIGSNQTAEAFDEDCDCETDGMVDPDDDEDDDGGIEFFASLDFMATGQNGTRKATSSIGYINMQNAIRGYADANNLDAAGIDNLSRAQLLQIFNDNAGHLSGQAKTDAVENAMAVFEVSKMSGTEEQMFAALKAKMNGASFGKQVGLITTFLANFSDNYDSASLDDPNSDDNIKMPQLMGAMRQSYLTGDDMDAGVCRHMHQAAVRLARSMGIKNAFGVGFRTQGGGHRTVMLSDPNDPRKMVQLNYGDQREMNGVAGPTALSQDGSIPDTGIRFRVYNGNDRLAIVLPSDKGAILNQVTGGQDSDLSPLYQSTAQIQQVGINTPYGTVRIFRGKAGMGNGEQVVGAAYNARVDYNDVFYGEYGVAGFYNQRQTEKGNMQGGGVYAQTTQGFNWTFFETDNVNLTAFGAVHLRGSYYCTSYNGDSCEGNYDYNIDGQAGLQANYQTGSVDHTTTIQTQVQFDPTYGDALGGGSPQVNAPVTSLTHDMIFELSPDITAQAGAGVHFVNLGADHQYFLYDADASIGFHNTGTSIGIGTQGAITPDTPYWLPGAAHQGSVSVNQSILGEHLNIGVTGSMDYTQPGNNHFVGVQIGGSF